MIQVYGEPENAWYEWRITLAQQQSLGYGRRERGIDTLASPWSNMKAIVCGSRRVFKVLSTAPASVGKTSLQSRGK